MVIGMFMRRARGSIPKTLLSLFELCSWPLVVAGNTARPDPRQVRVDVGARMRGMWR
jgi:DNA helicase-2/ATP-dependent DNA helicase PcrA